MIYCSVVYFVVVGLNDKVMELRKVSAALMEVISLKVDVDKVFIMVKLFGKELKIVFEVYLNCFKLVMNMKSVVMVVMVMNVLKGLVVVRNAARKVVALGGGVVKLIDVFVMV